MSFLKQEAPEEIRQVLYYLRLKYKWEFTNLEDLKKYNPKIRKTLMKYLSEKPENYGLRFFKKRLDYVFDTIKNIFGNRGFTMTFSGVDGAGKSTIIKNVKEQLEKKYRRNVVVLRHRPSILPILSSYRYGKEKAEQRAAQSPPRKGNNKNKLTSILRFFYYYSDYLLGQFYVNVRYLWRGYVVVYDRYYFDFIVDSKRSNIEIPKSIPTFLYRFVNHPKLNLFLYACPETIRERKKELDFDSIGELTESYTSHFLKSLKRKAFPVNTFRLKTTTKKKLLAPGF